MTNAVKQQKNSAKHLQAYQWKKGQSGNPNGRPKGKTLKEWVRERIEHMTEEERDAFLEGIPKEKIWEMVEGKPDTSGSLDVRAEVTLAELSDEQLERIISKRAGREAPNS